MRGVSALQSDWLTNDESDDLRVFMVWSPELDAAEGDVPGATRLMSDSRVAHFWDPEATVGRAFSEVLGTRNPAWDVWMLFEEKARWDERPPEPAWWEHQLGGLPRDRYLDPRRFASKAAEVEAAGP